MFQYSLRNLMLFVAILGLLPVFYGNMLIPFAVILIISIILGCHEFGSGSNAEPPNFS
ncbi:MAG: hypothetical protein ACOVQM_09060 [Pirellula sp.]